MTHVIAQYEALRDVLGLDQINASLSFCVSSSVILPTPLNSHPGRSFLYDNGSRLLKRFTKNLLKGMPSNCTHGTAGYWDMPAPKNSPMGTSDKIPDKAKYPHMHARLPRRRTCTARRREVALVEHVSLLGAVVRGQRRGAQRLHGLRKGGGK